MGVLMFNFLVILSNKIRIMPKNTYRNIDTSNFIPSFFLIVYLCLGFVPNWEAVDKIAPQWLLMGVVNTLTVLYVGYHRASYGQRISQTY
jgi:hypothetical protein